MYRITTVALLLFLSCSVVTFGFQGETDNAAFLLGWKTGGVDLHEAKVLDAFVTIRLLEGMKGERIERVVGLKRTGINIDLLALSMYLDEMAEVAEWPEAVRAIAEIKSANVKKAFHSLRRARREGSWEDTDPENEEAIQRVFAVYEEFGNLLRIKSN